MNSYRLPISFFLIAILLSSCRKFIEVAPPKTQLASTNIFTSDETAISSMRGIYSRMMGSAGYASGGRQSIATLAGLSADELTNFATTGENALFFNNAVIPESSNINSFLWSEPYKYIYTVNSVLTGLQQSTKITDSVKRQLTGEAKFVRAFCYFYLVNLFGDVPLDTMLDYHVNSTATRTPVSQVYIQIVADLQDAKTLLPKAFANDERTLPTSWAAAALLARAALYTHDWSKAALNADDLINNTTLFQLLSNPTEVFLKNSKETIWQLQPVIANFNTNEGRYGVLTTAPANTSLSDSLAHSFEPGDIRKSAWVGSIVAAGKTYYYPYKYKIITGTPVKEYSMVIRLAEIYLIRAEARARLNNLAGALADINAIRTRANLPIATMSALPDLLLAIEQERKIELFSEWGHRWLDLKRTNRLDAVVGTLKGSSWQSTDSLYPIPAAEIQNNSAIIQNPGY